MVFIPYSYTHTSVEGEPIFDKDSGEYIVEVVTTYRIRPAELEKCKLDLENQKVAIENLDKNVLVQEKEAVIQVVDALLIKK